MKESISKSIDSVLALTARVTKAGAYAHFEQGRSEGNHSVVVFSDGTEIDVPSRVDLSPSEYASVVVGNAWIVLRAIQIDKVSVLTIAFRFLDPEQFAQRNTLAALDHGYRLIESLLHQRQDMGAQLRLAEQAIELEWRLLEEKVADRAWGLVTPHEASEGGLQALDTHLVGLFGSLTIKPLLVERIHDLETRIAERNVVARAKELLRSQIGISEAQAYARLRALSRSSRRRIGEVALELLTRSDVLLELTDVRDCAHG